MGALLAGRVPGRSRDRAKHPGRKGYALGGGTQIDEAVVIRLAGELDAGQPTASDALLRAVEEGASQLIVDMIDVSFVDSSVVRALLLAERATSAAGGWLRVVFTHHVITRVIEICGLTAVLPQYATVEAARRGVQRTVRSGELEAREEDPVR